jgi:16S rRNA (adenine1518-N6/adenine1519-N6)-dimethyltransferase
VISSAGPARVKPKQSLGQNFLVDDNIARNIVRELHLSADDVVVEIGPGQGALTKHLVGAAKKLIAVEVDGRVVEELRNKFESPGVTILHGDFLEVDLPGLMEQSGRRLRLVGNIPYHLTSSILFKAFEERRALVDCTLMIQREVARRISARRGTKEYGILSVFTTFYGSPKILFNVSPNCFYPRPNVTSTVITIALHPELPAAVDQKLFATVVKTTFGKRRKTLRNSLKFLPFEEDVVLRIIGGLDFPLEKRPEELSTEEFIELTGKIGAQIG